MEKKEWFFVGGSRNGFWPLTATPPTLIFVDGETGIPDKEGVIEKRLNATVEQYSFEKVRKDHDRPPVAAYFLQGMDRDERNTRLEALLKRFPVEDEISS